MPGPFATGQLKCIYKAQNGLAADVLVAALYRLQQLCASAQLLLE